MQRTFCAQPDVLNIDIVSAVWERLPVNDSKFARFKPIRVEQ